MKISGMISYLNHREREKEKERGRERGESECVFLSVRHRFLGP